MVSGLRPIAVGEVIRCLASKCATRSVQPEVLYILTPLQLWVGITLRYEVIVHAAASCLKHKCIPPEKRFIHFITFFNVINLVHHFVLFREVREHSAGMSAWMEYNYGAQPLFHLSAHTLYSCSSV